jgi:hypothetical protein
MSAVNRLLVLSILFLIICCLPMSATTTKTCWPELIGKTANEAVEVIKQESGRKEKQSIEEVSISLI